MKTTIKLLALMALFTYSLGAQTRNGVKMDSDTLVMEGVYADKNIIVKNA